MAKDIEEFLKMAAKRRQQQKKQGGRPAGAAPVPPAAPAPARPAPARRAPIQPATDEEIVVVGKTTPMRHESVAEHVKSHIDTSSLGEHASHLGEEVALADDKLDARLHGKFDHSIGHLKIDKSHSAFSTTTTTTKVDVSPIADDLLNMLSNPKSIRQAILLNEILQRPNFDD